ncbi:MAG TPA: sugar phosphate isomerase/epimerase [Clostridiales bacterium]|nr:sugar phosphate isomerase/epimerase [Clostridiales bacterium]
MRKVGVSLIGGIDIPKEEQIRIIHDCGYDCFFSGYYDDEPIYEWKELGQKIGIEFETVHLPFKTADGLTANDLWEDTLSGETYFEIIKKQIDGCSKAEIPIGVMHVSCDSKGPEPGKIGIDRFKKLCDYSEKKKVKLAFENLELPEHLYKVMDIIGDFHGFCWDCGHNLCYTPEIDMSEKFGDKIICTHIHDNLGVRQPGNISWMDDLHLLPFDGSLDWEWYGRRIKEIGYKGPLTMELQYKYKNMPLESFFKTAFERIQKIKAFTE